MLSLPDPFPAAEAKRMGGPRGPRRHNLTAFSWAAQFGVSLRVVRRVGLERLAHCKDDDARRLLLSPREAAH